MFYFINMDVFKRTMITLCLFSLLMGGSSAFAKEEADTSPFGIIDLPKLITELPESSDRIVIDKRLLESNNKGIRVFRLYNPVPAHYHEKSDAVLYLIEGEVSVAINQGEPQRVTAGKMMHWQRGVIHAVPEIHSGTATFIVIDIPMRDPADAIFLDNKDVEFLH